jgi:hypothetical protein
MILLQLLGCGTYLFDPSTVRRRTGRDSSPVRGRTFVAGQSGGKPVRRPLPEPSRDTSQTLRHNTIVTP